MRIEVLMLAVAALSFGVLPCGSACAADSPADRFTYQGRLREAGSYPTGVYDMRFTLLTEGGVELLTLCSNDVSVIEGHFTVLVQVGAEFPNIMRVASSLLIAVRPDEASKRECSDSSGFTRLTPSQPFSAAPLSALAKDADRAANADRLSGMTVSQLTNAGNLTGTLPDVALSPNVPRLDATNTFSGTNTFGNVQATGWIGSTTGPVELRTNGQRGLLINFNRGYPNVTVGHSSNAILGLAYASVISGGSFNQVSAVEASVGGGSSNQVTSLGDGATIGGGSNNLANGFKATIGGGYFNSVEGSSSVIGGGALNMINASFATIAGGSSADLLDPFGTNNRVTDDFGSIGGGGGNRAGNGAGTTSDASFATVAGGKSNSASAEFSSILGGAGNRASTQYASVGGGVNNNASGGGFATIAGGSENSASGFVATVGGGDFNIASGERSIVSGGNGNQATGRFTNVSGGIANLASGEAASVAGGAGNMASGAYAFAAAGANNRATGFASFAGGNAAQSLHDGSFVWADTSLGSTPTQSTSPNQFTIRAAGGVRVLGNVSVDGNIAYAAPRLTYRMYAVGEFLPATRNTVDVPVRSGFYGEVIRGPDGSTITFRVPITLPQGARIREISVYYNDLDATRYMRFFLLRTALPSQSASVLSEITTESAGGSQRTISLPIPTPIVVDNQTGSLEFVVQPELPSGPGVSIQWSSNLQIAGMRLTYDTDGPVQ